MFTHNKCTGFLLKLTMYKMPQTVDHKLLYNNVNLYCLQLSVGFWFYKHQLRYDRNWILSCNLYVMFCLCEVRYQTVWSTECSAPNESKHSIREVKSVVIFLTKWDTVPI